MQKPIPNELAEAISKHSKSPDISVEAYVKTRALELNASISGIDKVYLDKRYWVLLRDAHMKRSKLPSSDRLLNVLKTAVESGKVLCPISESVFLELLKQQDLNTRRATAELIDELSRGVTLIPFDQRIAQEFVGVFSKFAQGAVEHHEVHELVWSKLSYVLGVVHPSLKNVKVDEELAMQKAFFDHMWQLSLVEILEYLEDQNTVNVDPFQSTADSLNMLNQLHSSEVRSFKKVYIDEFRGGLSLFMHIPRLWLENAYKKATGKSYIATESEKLDHEKKLHTYFGNLIKEKRAALMLPTLHISALCHAAVRWDKGRKLSRNDFYDFHHAEAAVGYCSAFLTEKPLMTMLKQKHLELEKDFSCKVMANADDATQWLVERVGG